MGLSRKDLDAHAAWLAPHLTVLTPTGAGPFPVAIQMHGCGGIQPMQFRYAETGRAEGFAVVVVDSLAPRGIGRLAAELTVCTGLQLRGAERAADLIAVLHWLGQQPWADAKTVVAAGWSHGGWSIMEAFAERRWPAAQAALLQAVEAVVLVYPYAGAPARTFSQGWGERRPRVHACLAKRDAVVGWKAPQRALDRLAADGVVVDTLLLDDATHCFDDDRASDPRTVYSATSEARMQAFYAAALAGVRRIADAGERIR